MAFASNVSVKITSPKFTSDLFVATAFGSLWFSWLLDSTDIAHRFLLIFAFPCPPHDHALSEGCFPSVPNKHLSSHAVAVAPLRFRPGPHPFLTSPEWSCLLLHCTYIYWAPTLSQISTDLSPGGKTSPCSCRFDICQGCQFHPDTGDTKPCSLSLFCPFGLLGYSMPPQNQYFQNWIFHP